jgi:DNA polymerase
MGRDFRVTRQRGRIVHTEWAASTMATIHPSAVLRAPDDEGRRQMREALIVDLKTAREHVREGTSTGGDRRRR